MRFEPQWQEPPEHALYYRYAPQRRLLKQAELFITHGGANSIAESLVEGVPVLASPVCNDQAHQAHFVERAGVGRTLDLQTASVAEIKAAILNMIGDAECKARVQEVRTSYQVNGALRAAQLISEIAIDKINLLKAGTSTWSTLGSGRRSILVAR